MTFYDCFKTVSRETQLLEMRRTRQEYNRSFIPNTNLSGMQFNGPRRDDYLFTEPLEQSINLKQLASYEAEYRNQAWKLYCQRTEIRSDIFAEALKHKNALEQHLFERQNASKMWYRENNVQEIKYNSCVPSNVHKSALRDLEDEKSRREEEIQKIVKKTNTTSNNCGVAVESCLSKNLEHVRNVKLNDTHDSDASSDSECNGRHSPELRPPTRRENKSHTQIIIEKPCNVIQTATSVEPLLRYMQIDLNESDLAGLMSFYLVAEEQLGSLGYPVASSTRPDRVTIYAVDFSKKSNKFNVDAPEFVPGSSSSSSSSDEDDVLETDNVRVMRKCARCTKGFFMTNNGLYLTGESCQHHWGRLHKKYDQPPALWKWSCCGGTSENQGCSRAPYHVWSGKTAGINGPYQGYIETKPRNKLNPGKHILALDTEMCYTGTGLQIAKIEVVAPDGSRVYGTYVHPELPIVDYNTRYSGITAEDMKKPSKSLKDVQKDLLQLIDSDTILIGHGLENDLRALKMLHGKIVDTAIMFPDERGLPYRKSLRSLAEMVLGNNVQRNPHCPLEDARLALDLVLWRLQRQFLAYTIPKENTSD